MNNISGCFVAIATACARTSTLFSDTPSTVDSDTVSTYQVSSVQLVTNKKLEAFNKA